MSHLDDRGTDDRTGIFGPALVNVMLQTLETGFIISQFISFCDKSGRFSRWVFGIVLFVTLASFFQTSITFYSIWVHVIVYDGYPIGGIPTSTLVLEEATPLFIMLSSAPVQALYTWRCYMILHRKPWIPTLLLTAVLASVALHIHATYELVRIGPASEDMGTTPQRINWVPTYLAALALNIVLDIALTGILLSFLLRSLKNVFTRRVRKVIQRLILLAWECALPPTLCATATCITYGLLSFRRTTLFWDTPLQGMLGKLYVISLLATLNNASFEQLEPSRRREPESPARDYPRMDTTIVLEDFTQAHPTTMDEEAQVESDLQSSDVGSGSSDTKNDGIHPWSIWRIPT
ncbi:hypothetical protein PENSPDRAFT_756660 [Peniophora sp. CONT]|nr:hypothetical protein PENSPDRAFT_756660 [Peniophora sp. CONT]